jgi:16S rRNA (uracil1498-N3)-methyltransferase
MQLFYYPHLTASTTFEFSEEESKHCIKVLRHQKGDTIQLMDGKGNLAYAMIENDHPKRCSGSIQQVQYFEPSLPYHFHLSIAPTKQHERLDWMLEKAIEMGVHQVSFIHCINSERPKVNLERLHKIAISAIKQSKQYHLPILNEMLSFKEVIEASQAPLKLIAYCPTGQEQSLYSFLKAQPQSIHLLVGPEGDFHPSEVSLAQAKGFNACSLGKNILRTETAALFSIAAAAAVLGQPEKS